MYLINDKLVKIYSFFYFLVPTHNRESIAFESNFQKEGFDGFRPFEITSIRKSHLENYSVCLCTCDYLSVFFWHNSKTNNSRRFKNDILHLYQMKMRLKYFYANVTNSAHIGAHKIIFIHYDL